MNRPENEPDPAESKDEAASIPLLAVTGDEASIEGDFKVADSLKIECEIGGRLDVGGTVVVGENGVVHADVRTVDALILGRYEGDMVATGEVEIAASGHVSGNIRTDSLVINRGGFFNGNVEALEETPESVPEPDGDSEAAESAALTAIAGGNGRSSENGSGTARQTPDSAESRDVDGGAAEAFLGQPAEVAGAGG